MTDVATTGPCHSRIAGMAKPVVLPVWVGPTTITDCRGSAATSRPSTRPSVSRPGSRAADPERAKIVRARPACRPVSVPFDREGGA